MTQQYKNSGSVVNAETIIGNVNNVHCNYLSYKKLLLDFERKSIFVGVESPDIDFAGRSLDLQCLKSAITTPPNVCVVTGLGGIGKTQLVRKFINENRTSYTNVICIDSQERGSLEEAFRTLAKDKLNISVIDDKGKDRDIVSIVKEVLSELSESKSLIVLDNIVNEQYLDTYNGNIIKIILKLETFGERPHVIITSRMQEWSDSIHRIKLDVLDSEDAIEFVSSTLDVPNNNYNDSHDEIQTLVEKLHSFPLALRQATAHIVHQRVEETFPIADYINKYNLQEILDSQFFRKDILNTYEKTTFTTWRVTLDAIKQNSTVGEVAIQILYIIAYFDYNNIPRDIFFNLLAQTQPISFINFSKQKRKKIVLKDTVQSAVRLLVNYSMIDSYQEPQNVLSIHRLVQEVIKIQLEREGQTIEILRDGLSLIQKYENIHEIHEHAMVVFISASQFTILLKKKELMLFSVKILISMIASEKYYRANCFVDVILKLYTKFFSEHNEYVLTIMLHIAELYRHLGKHSDALRIFEDVFVKQRKILGKYNRNTLITQTNIALSYRNLGRHSASLQIYEEVYKKRIKVLGKDHLWTLRSKSNSAQSYRDLGRHSVALQMYQEVFEKQMKILGEEHLWTLRSKSNIAQSYRDLEKHSDALQIFEDVLAKLKKSVGEDHLDMVNTKYNIANSYRSLRKHSLALQIFLDVFDKRKERLGENHPDTLISHYSIGQTYSDLGKHSDALYVFQKVFEKRKNILGDNHPDTLDTESNIGLANGYLGKHSDALQILQAVFEKRKYIFGKDHPDTLNDLYNIANSYRSLGKHSDELNVKQQIAYRTLIMIYKLKYNMVPESMARMENGELRIVSFVGPSQPYPLRNDDDFELHTTTKASMNSIFHKGIIEFNKLPDVIKSETGYTKFKELLVAHMKDNSILMRMAAMVFINEPSECISKP